MTTDAELHDLLTTEASGATGGAGGWDDVIRRGRHRQRVRRAQGVAVVALVAGVAGLALSLTNGDSSVDTGPPANQPSTSMPDAPTTTTTVPVPDDVAPHILAARRDGAFLMVLIPGTDPASEFDPCVALHPRVVESPDQIGIELVTEDVARGLPFAACTASPFSGRAVIELTDPAGDRPVVDLTTGNAVFSADSASLLFPTTLPDGFSAETHDEFASQGAWTFSFSSTKAPAYINVTTGYGGMGECDRRSIEVRDTTGRLCEGEDGRYDLHWEEGGQTIAVEVGSTEPLADSGLTLGDVLAIAEGLEPSTHLVTG
jgi:hypothetical protein